MLPRGHDITEAIENLDDVDQLNAWHFCEHPSVKGLSKPYLTGLPTGRDVTELIENLHFQSAH